MFSNFLTQTMQQRNYETSGGWWMLGGCLVLLISLYYITSNNICIRENLNNVENGGGQSLSVLCNRCMFTVTHWFRLLLTSHQCRDLVSVAGVWFTTFHHCTPIIQVSFEHNAERIMCVSEYLRCHINFGRIHSWVFGKFTVIIGDLQHIIHPSARLAEAEVYAMCMCTCQCRHKYKWIRAQKNVELNLNWVKIDVNIERLNQTEQCRVADAQAHPSMSNISTDEFEYRS